MQITHTYCKICNAFTRVIIFLKLEEKILMIVQISNKLTLHIHNMTIFQNCIWKVFVGNFADQGLSIFFCFWNIFDDRRAPFPRLMMLNSYFLRSVQFLGTNEPTEERCWSRSLALALNVGFFSGHKMALPVYY